MINHFRRIRQQLRYSKSYQGAVKEASQFRGHPRDMNLEVLLVVMVITFVTEIAHHSDFISKHSEQIKTTLHKTSILN